MKLEAYYPFEDRVVSVSYALPDQNDGEYRENPCVWSKQAWEDVTQKRESRRASFVFYSGKEHSKGVQAGKYTNTGLRVNDTIEKRIWSQVPFPCQRIEKRKKPHQDENGHI